MVDSPLLRIALGEPGSGRVRYGAAMAAFHAGHITAEQLECYRIASADDDLDPAPLLRECGLSTPRTLAASGEDIIRTLINEADNYLRSLDGPGIAEVRQGIARFRNQPFVPRQYRPHAVVERHLPTALKAAQNDQPALAALIAAAEPYLAWISYDLYDRAKIGESFVTSHAFCSLIGEQGALLSDDFDLGLFLIAPDILYRDHCHAAPELYAPLTGPHGWRFRPEGPLTIKPAHEPVWNEPFRPHLTKVGPTPFLCLYCWTRDNDKPAEVLPAADWAELESLSL